TPATLTYTLSLHDALPISDRVADRPVGLDEVLLGHDQRLRLGLQVAVVAGVVERGGHDGEAAGEGGVVDDAGRAAGLVVDAAARSEEHTSELQSRGHLVCR